MAKTEQELMEPDPSGTERRKSFVIYILFLIAYLSVQFGHGSNIGVAVSLPGSSKAMNMALGSWVMVGVSLGLPLTPVICRTFGAYPVSCVCVLVDVLVVLLMLWPDISLNQIYFVRFLVGFFEAPFLPYLQEWLARWGRHNWNVWNTVLHAMVPLGENLGYILCQELVASGFSWQMAFLWQAVALAVSVLLIYIIGGRKYLDLSAYEKAHHLVNEDPSTNGLDSSPNNEDMEDSEVEYPATERWCVFWAVNVSLAAQLGFLGGSKYVIRDYAKDLGFSLDQTIFTFSAIALIGPALGGSIAMSGSVIRPDQWSHHKKTLTFLACTSSVAAAIALLLPFVPKFMFWPALFLSFTAAGGVYPAAQGIIQIALTASRVIEASVYQAQCNNILFAMPMPYAIGKIMDSFSVETSFKVVVGLQLLAALGFIFAALSATFTEERSAWQHRLVQRPQSQADAEASDIELSNRSTAELERQRFLE